ncbi:MAG: peptidoglycan DD-metalloendopeptidase family protein [Acidobacteriota bacterium]|nr:peptidoglycan DD-metalloendopeptidase family protein [Acidobacteriota bacterium]
MRKRFLVPAVVLLVAAASLPMWLSAANPVSIARLGTDIALARDADYLTGLVPMRTTIAAVLDRHLIEGPEKAVLVASIGGAFDLRRIRAGQAYLIDRLLDGRVRRFEYEIDGDRRLTATRGSLDGTPRFHTAIEPIPKETAVVMVEGAIDRDTNSLSAALDKAGERIDLALGLADVFSGEIDFNSGLQPGDSFRLLVERQTREGKLAGYGPILAAEFVNVGRQLRAIRFTPEGGAAAYYDDQGRSLKRFFLKSPLKFEPRVTSRFSTSRKHPVLGYARAHNGVDYSANTGAPVVSVAPGVVTLAGWTNGGGRTVKVRHPNGYETEYLHLSSIAVRQGARISQGQLVGLVGMTGLATGPHLHYGLKKGGRYVNPVLEHRNMPPGDPVPAGLQNVFSSERDRYMSLLFSSPAARAANN